MMEGVQAPNTTRRKRKAESQENERLSKRLSLLNLERNGQKLYVPVEEPSASSSTSSKITRTSRRTGHPPIPEDDSMHLDDTKHKVYIYDLDAELSSDSEASDDGRLVFLPDIKKHLRESRIPPIVLANNDGELAGMNKQMVLYNVPSSLTIPEEQDSVRKAIIETRARTRARLEEKRKRDLEEIMTEGSRREEPFGFPSIGNNAAWINGGGSWNTFGAPSLGMGGPSLDIPVTTQALEDDDPDAMDLG